MTNIYTIVDGPDGEPTVARKSFDIRGYYYDKIIKIINEEGWEAGASKVCRYCGGYIEDDDENSDVSRICSCEEPDPNNPNAPI